jgi:hypothetical protein
VDIRVETADKGFGTQIEEWAFVITLKDFSDRL